MDGTRRDGAVRVGDDARQRFYDSRGYGRPLSGNEIELSYVEAAHLLFRGDLDAVDGQGFESFFVRAAGERDRFALRFLVYADLRERGFYLSPVREDWPGGHVVGDEFAETTDFAVYPRGKGPGDGVVEYRVRVVGERRPVAAGSLAGHVLAVVDEESELTYFEAGRPEFEGATAYEPPASLAGVDLEDRVVCWDPPEDLYERGFYGQRLAEREGLVSADAVQLSLVEAAYLAAEGVLELDGGGDGGDDNGGASAYDAIVERGRAVEGERFDRRLRVYATLRSQGVVPKTGYKFGADFRTYDDVETVSDLPHSERLVRVIPPDHEFSPRALSLDVRLAGGVRKQMVFALVGDNDEVEWLSVSRITP